ncbi:hypothetical protein Tco_1209713 [Tanacetum coccineum]
MEADRVWNDFGVDFIDVDDLHSGDEGDNEQPPQTRKRILPEIRREYKGKEKIKEQLRRDHQQQYAIIRDYAMELKERNKDTTVKIQVETNTGLTLNSKVFKRIYVFLGPLKDGYKALRRELLGGRDTTGLDSSVLLPQHYHVPIGRPRKKRRVTQDKKSEKALKQQMVKNGKLSRKGNTMSYGKCGVTGGSSQAMDSQVSGSQKRKSARQAGKEPAV